jgi:hypothetical protein
MNIDHGVRNSIYCTLRHEPLSCSAPQRTESRAPCRGRGGLTATRGVGAAWTPIGTLPHAFELVNTDLMS